ncbi:conserved hypothetical protein [Amphritea japonica ATCC BAA-1530]|uniref:Uncharacterized protein n=2 Tax=Amphritea TaxID=515417 RepID=A0A7R6P5H3_9GAMM|nr:conserved hypothetical protein [Amphritea japonica ATCC BAA-1530]
MTNTPASLQDAKDLLTEQGLATSDTWYHGTSSALIDSIKAQGLKRSGDKALKAAAKKTMATIGNSYTESIEPVFLTQSKELAFYWAEQTVRDRSVRIEGEEQPVVFEIKLPEEQNIKVKPDVGAASLLLVKEGENFMAFLAGIYQSNGFGAPEIDLMKADRLEYLNKLGMAYVNVDIDASYLTLITD